MCALGVAHRDIKPSNILMTPSGAPMLSDFDISRTLHEESGHTVTTAEWATPNFAPPEWKGSSNQHPAAAAAAASAATAVASAVSAAVDAKSQAAVSPRDAKHRAAELFDSWALGLIVYLMYAEVDPKVFPPTDFAATQRVAQSAGDWKGYRVCDIAAVNELVNVLLVVDPSKRMSVSTALKELSFFSKPPLEREAVIPGL